MIIPTAIHIKKASYTYTLAASLEMSSYPIQRLTSVCHDPGLGPGIKTFSFPFLDFPSLESHVHPAFVICHAAKFLVDGETMINYSHERRDLFDLLVLVVQIYKKWINASLSASSLTTPINQDGRGEHAFGRISLTPSTCKNSDCHHDIDSDGERPPIMSKRKRQAIKRWVSSIAR